MSARTQPIPAAGTDRRRLSGPALRTFFRIADLWGLSADEQMTLLGLTAKSTFYKWKKNPSTVLPRDTLERISYVVGIYKALQILLPDKRAADGWMTAAERGRDLRRQVRARADDVRPGGRPLHS